jgi:hypothetical protein
LKAKGFSDHCQPLERCAPRREAMWHFCRKWAQTSVSPGELGVVTWVVFFALACQLSFRSRSSTKPIRDGRCCLLVSRTRSAPRNWTRFPAQYSARGLPCERFTSALAGRRASPGSLGTPMQVAHRAHHHRRRQDQIPIALAAEPVPHFPRLRALVLFGRRPPQCETPARYCRRPKSGPYPRPYNRTRHFAAVRDAVIGPKRFRGRAEVGQLLKVRPLPPESSEDGAGPARKGVLARQHSSS